MVNELAKSMQQHYKIFENPILSAIEAMKKGLSLQAKLAISQITLDAISSINCRHEYFLGNLRSTTEAINKNQAAFNQINSWQFVISGISGQHINLTADFFGQGSPTFSGLFFHHPYFIKTILG